VADRAVAMSPTPPPGPDGLSDADFVDWCYRRILVRESDDGGRRHYVAALAQGLSRLGVVNELFDSDEYRERFAACRLFPPGHALSPLPSGADIAAHRTFNWQPDVIPGVVLRTDEQWRLVERLGAHYPRLPFQRQATPGRRYYFENDSYSYADAVFLGCLMLELRPRRIIEVGSGFSSAAMLDLDEVALDGSVEFTFIDPDPSRLRPLLKERDARARVLDAPVQHVPDEVFQALEPRDILFIDSSHVSKVGSDVNRLFFDILPLLRPGVFIHVHDVLYPFEYPQAWLERGWVWNEQYLLHAFLQYNDRFAIRLFSSMLLRQRPDWFATHMPDCLRNPGGCLWIERTA
jgi:predicted O-methyltransferase YrrM